MMLDIATQASDLRPENKDTRTFANRKRIRLPKGDIKAKRAAVSLAHGRPTISQIL